MIRGKGFQDKNIGYKYVTKFYKIGIISYKYFWTFLYENITLLSHKKLKIAPGDNNSTRKYMTHNTKFTTIQRYGVY